MTIYVEFARFLLPLVLTIVVQEIGGQVLSGGMARVPRATETLAAYGLAWGLVMLLTSPLWQVKQLGLVLVDSRRSLRTVSRFVVLSSLTLAGVLALLALTPLGVWVVEDLHRIGPDLGAVARTALLWFIPFPLFKGLSQFYAGLLIRLRRTDLVSYAVTAGIVANLAAVFALLPAAFVQRTPIWLPILVTYAGVLVELAVIYWGHRRTLGPLPEGRDATLGFSYVLRFFWPLALIMGIQGLSRPTINLFVSRGPSGEEALAVLTVVYALAHLPYGWVNEVRNLPAAFREVEDNLAHVRRFTVACGLLSFALMALLFWTPLRDVILGTLIGLAPDLAVRAVAPLIVFTFFPLVVMVRAYFHGVGLVEHRTKAMAPSAPLRIAAILAALVALPGLGVQGATLGVAALLAGFVAETLAVRWGLRRGRVRSLGVSEKPITRVMR